MSESAFLHNVTSTQIIFSLLDYNYPSKHFALSCSAILAIINTHLLWIIISYEGNCHNRILINRLISCILASWMVFNVSAQVLITMRYLAGPFPEILCQVEYVSKNVPLQFAAIMINCILAVRYIFTFYSKNPTAVQDDFWTVFITIWSAGVCTICQSVTIWFPGKNPMMFYFCLGKLPVTLVEAPIKKNASFDFVVIFTLASHLFTSIKFWIFKKEGQQGIQPKDFSARAFITQKLNKESMYRPLVAFLTFTCYLCRLTMISKSKGPHVVAMVGFFISSITPRIINNIDPKEIGNYPNYLLVYTHHLITAQVTIACTLVLLFLTNQSLSLFHKRYCQEILAGLRERFFKQRGKHV